MNRLQAIKKCAVQAIVPRWNLVPESCYPTVTAFPFSYSVGRSIVEFCEARDIKPGQSRILIVGAHGGRDYHWLRGFGYQVDVLDLGDHQWGKSRYVGDACRPNVGAGHGGLRQIVCMTFLNICRRIADASREKV